MKRSILALALVLSAARLSAQPHIVWGRGFLDSTYCQLAGCTMIGTATFPAGSAAAPSIKGTGATTSGIFWGTNFVGLSSNGVASLTFDSSQNGTFGANVSLPAAGILAWSTDAKLRRGGAGIVQQSDGVNGQNYLIYNTTDSDTSPVNYERGVMGWSANILTLQTQKGGTGTLRDLSLSGNNLQLWSNGIQRFNLLSGGAFTPNGDNATTTTVGDATHRLIAYVSREITGASTPTAASTGTGTGPTNTVDTGSSDAGGTITVTAGTTPAAVGTITVTFSTGNGAYGTNAPVCVALLGNGTGTWNARATVIGGTFATTSAVFNWDNNAVNLTAASTYKLHYECIGK